MEIENFKLNVDSLMIETNQQYDKKVITAIVYVFNDELNKCNNISITTTEQSVNRELLFSYNPYLLGYIKREIPNVNDLLIKKEQKFLNYLSDESYTEVKKQYKISTLNILKQPINNYEEIVKQKKIN